MERIIPERKMERISKEVMFFRLTEEDKKLKDGVLSYDFESLGKTLNLLFPIDFGKEKSYGIVCYVEEQDKMFLIKQSEGKIHSREELFWRDDQWTR